MPRAERSFQEGRIYHVYSRVCGGSMELSDEELAATFVVSLRMVVDRDEVTVLAWCLLGNHYHRVVRQGPVPLSRPMKTLQQRVTRARNVRKTYLASEVSPSKSRHDGNLQELLGTDAPGWWHNRVTEQ